MTIKSKLLAVALLAGGSMFAQSRVAIGVNIGGYGPGVYPPPAYVAYRPPCPGPGYTWVNGFWGPGRAWTAGYWRAPVVVAPRYVAPRYVAPRYYNGYRGNDRGRDWDRHDHHDRGHRR